MTPSKIGQVVKFHTPLPDENPDQLYVVLEIKEDGNRSRADIKPLHTGLSFPPINTVRLNELTVVELPTDELIGHHVTITKSDYSEAEGRVIKTSEQKINLDLTKGVKGVETNVWLTILDDDGKEHTGTLVVRG